MDATSERVLRLLAAGVPLRLLIDIAGVGPSSAELLRDERDVDVQRTPEWSLSAAAQPA